MLIPAVLGSEIQMGQTTEGSTQSFLPFVLEGDWYIFDGGKWLDIACKKQETHKSSGSYVLASDAWFCIC